MEQIAWIVWLVVGVGLIIAEIFTLGFVLFWFGVGGLAAALAAYLGFGFGIQFLVFAVISIALTAMSRTIFYDYLPQAGEHYKTGMDNLPGQVGTVTAGSSGALSEGAVKVYGSTWTAFPEDEETKLVEGEKVEVVRVQGSSLYVRKVSPRELPDWRGSDDAGS
jgi:membrane protein implicated in regulation of membrane protease activity